MPVRNQGFVYTSIVGPRDPGRTALSYLGHRYEHTTAAGWAARFDAGEIDVRGELATPATPVEVGDRVTWRRPPWDEPDVPMGFGILHEDEHVLVVDKPSGVPTMPSGGFLVNTLLTQVQRQFPTATPMHRLGTGTSGIVVFALTGRARAHLQAEWRAGRVEKIYRALVHGEPPEGRIDVPIGPVPHLRMGSIHAATATGKPATSHVRRVEPHGEQSWVEVQIDTGRPHQIRIHLAAIGHPLVGDPLFGPGGAPNPDALATDVGYELRAVRIALAHPLGGELAISAPLRPGGSLRAP